MSDSLASMMYTTALTKSEDLEDAFQLMDQNPFATLMSYPSGAGDTVSTASPPEPFISHLPLVVRRETRAEKDSAPTFTILGHCARANAHWRLLESQPVTVIFQGAHAYITPKWYAKNDVPTWNYSAVHVSGRAELIEDFEGLIDCLKILSTHAEQQWPSGWEFYLPPDLSNPNVVVKSIVGFRITVDKILFKKKLAQRLSAADRASVIAGLRARGDDQSRGVAEAMAQLPPAKQ